MEEDRELGRAEAKAFRLLALRAHSEQELRAKLRTAGFTSPVIEQAVLRCLGLGYLNDESFARQRARALAVGRLSGNRRIALDLRERGIDAELSQRVIAEIREEVDEEEAARRLLQKKMRGRPVAGLDERERARLARGLMSRGFPTSLILKVLKKTEEDGFHGDDGE
jgi:regulatory protein